MRKVSFGELVNKQERKLKIDIVYHFSPFKTAPDKFRNEVMTLKKQGLDSIHFDFRWDEIYPNRRLNKIALKRYIKALQIIRSAGMKEPTIILSNPPSWIKNLYLESKRDFFKAYRRYVSSIEKELSISNIKIKRVQVLNELNNPYNTPINKEDLLVLFADTRLIFFKNNPNLEIVLSLLAANLTELQADLGKKLRGVPLVGKIPLQKSIWEYMEFFKNQTALFDVVSVCHYPGVWNLPVKESLVSDDSKLTFYERMIRNLQFLREVFYEIATWDRRYEIGEIGFPTNFFWGNELFQIEAYKIFTKQIKKMLEEFKKQGIERPSRITFYEANDDYPDNLIKQFLRLTPYPEYGWGLMTRDGKPKKILKNGTSPSELSTLIKNIKS